MSDVKSFLYFKKISNDLERKKSKIIIVEIFLRSLFITSGSFSLRRSDREYCPTCHDTRSIVLAYLHLSQFATTRPESKYGCAQLLSAGKSSCSNFRNRDQSSYL